MTERLFPCNKCREMKPIGAYYADSKVCRACRTAAARAWRARNPERAKLHKERQKERIRQRNKERYATDPDYRAKVHAAYKRWKDKQDPERIREMRRAYWEKRKAAKPPALRKRGWDPQKIIAGKERKNARFRERYASDPEFRERALMKRRLYQAKLRARRFAHRAHRYCDKLAAD